MSVVSNVNENRNSPPGDGLLDMHGCADDEQQYTNSVASFEKGEPPLSDPGQGGDDEEYHSGPGDPSHHHCRFT